MNGVKGPIKYLNIIIFWYAGFFLSFVDGM